MHNDMAIKIMFRVTADRKKIRIDFVDFSKYVLLKIPAVRNVSLVLAMSKTGNSVIFDSRMSNMLKLVNKS